MTTTHDTLPVTVLVGIVLSRSSMAGAQQRVKVTMRDSVRIETFVKTPGGKGCWPAVFKKGYSITTRDADAVCL